MTGNRLMVCGLIAMLIVAGGIGDADAHGLIGKCFLPATLAIDDPFVADELSLPTISHIKMPASSDSPAAKETDLSAEFSKRLTPDLGISVGATYTILDQEHDVTLKGFDNMDVTLKYVFFRNAEHQILVAAGLGWEVGGTGSKQIADSFDRVIPQLFWGKCLGDLPDAVSFLQPLVFTGVFGVSMPTRHANKVITTDPETGDVDIHRTANPSIAQWGFSVQYNLYYLQSFVRDVELRAPFNRLIPLVEFAMQTPLDDPKTAGRTTGTINPGIIWFGRYVQVGVEAQIPVNDRTGKNVGVLGQLHFYLDDIAPQIFTWTPFHGVLGPTFPR
jgi:hypothetical protein